MKMRPLRTPEEFMEAEELQKTVWNFPEREIIPLNELTVISKHGGCALGVFERGKMIAFCFGQPAYRKGKSYHYSRILGVLPEYRDRGLGHRLKREQRRYVLQQKQDLVCWTFDPLQSRNAALNLSKLGCIVREYIVDLYPTSDSKFNRGVGSDRFVPEWWVASRHVRDALKGKRSKVGKASDVIAVRWNQKKQLTPGRVSFPVSKHVTVEIPLELDRLKKSSLSLARKWRLATRRAFQGLFRRGYVAHDFITETIDGRRRGRYLLTKGFRVR